MTFELEAHGVTANGITATQYTTDVPVNPGEVISFRVRAIPPAGYECGDPLALCHPSPWSTLAQTLPAVPTGVLGHIEPSGSGPMTIARRGSTNYSAQLLNTSNSFTITKESTVQSGDLLFIGVSSYSNTNGDISITGFTSIYEVTYSGRRGSVFYREIDGSEGSTFTINISGGNDRYAGAVLIAFSGNDLSIEANRYTDNANGTSPSAPSVTAAGTDTMLLSFYLYSDPASFTAPAGSDGSFANSPQNTNSAAISWDAVSASGATGTRTATLGTSRKCLGVSVLLKETGGGAATVSPNDMLHAQSIDSATLLQAHILAVAELLHSQAFDNATLTQAFTLTPNDAINTQAIDATTLLQQSVISPADLLHGNTLDTTALIQAHTLAIADITHAQTIDNLTIVVSGDITPNEMMTLQAMDSPLLLQAHIIAPNDALNAQSIYSPIIVQSNVLVPAGIDHAVILDSPVIVQANVISTSELLTAQAVDNVTLAVLGSLSVDDLLSSQAIESPGLTQAHTIAPAELTHVNSIDASELFQGFILVPADLLHGQAIEGALLDVIFGLSPADLLNAQWIESPGLIQAHVIFPADLLQANRFDVAGISSGLLQVPTGRAIVLGASDRYVLLTPADRFILLTKSTRAVS